MARRVRALIASGLLFACGCVNQRAASAPVPAPSASTPAAPQGATARPQGAAAAQAAPGLVCFMERPIGSNIWKRVCFTEEQLERQREISQDDLRRAVQKGTQSQR
jgi:hypothetical protein